MDNMRAQAERFSAEMIDDDIISVDLTGDIKLLTDSAGTVHRAKTVITAAGSGCQAALDTERYLAASPTRPRPRSRPDRRRSGPRLPK